MADTILIVDDNEQNRKLFRILLLKNGFDVIEAENGVGGVKLAQERLPRLVLMDIQMPDMDGLAALSLLKKDSRTSNIPVIALTSYAMKGDRERFLSSGFVDYLSKPVKLDDLLRSIKITLERHYG